MAISVSPKQASRLVLKALKAKLVPMLHSSPGCAKSSIIHAIAKEHKLKLIDLRLSQMDITDMQGLPYFNEDHTKSSFVPPDYFPLESDPLPANYNGWLIFFDELSSAPPLMQAASYKIILDRLVGQAKLHSKVAIVAAGNLTTDKAVVSRMSTALQSRLVHLKIELHAKDWLEWATKNDIDYRITSYIGWKPDALHVFDPNHNDLTFSCARTWEFTSDILKDEPVVEMDILPLLAGTIGEGPAREFQAFTNIFEELPTIDEIIANPTGVNISAEPSIKFALSGLITAYLTAKNIDQLIKCILRLPIEFQTITLQQSVIKNLSLVHTQPVKDWMLKNKSLLFNLD